MRAASGRAKLAPGTIARMVRRVVICLEIPSSSAVPGWRKRVNRALTLGRHAPYVADGAGWPQGRPADSEPLRVAQGLH